MGCDEIRLQNHIALAKCKQKVTGTPEQRWAKSYIVDMGAWSACENVDGEPGNILISPEMRKIQVQESKSMLEDLAEVKPTHICPEISSRSEISTVILKFCFSSGEGG